MLALSAFCIGLFVVAAPQAQAATTVLSPGDDVQAAINAANPGDTIQLSAGVYPVSLEITKTLKLKGKGGVTLVPPASPPSTFCNGPGFTEGICIHGPNDSFDSNGPIAGSPSVTNVMIQGLQIQNFSGDGTFVFNSNGFQASNNSFMNNGGYGIFVNTSSNSTLHDNLSDRNHEAGFYFGDSPNANVNAYNNTSSRNAGFGIFLRDAEGGTISNNSTWGNCVGILVLADAPGPSGHWNIKNNIVSANNKGCPGSEDGPPVSGVGIGVIGGNSVKITGNTVTDNNTKAPSAFMGGILIGQGFSGTNPSVQVNGNVARRNAPADIVWDGNGSVTGTGNDCGTSSPSGFCGP